MQAAPSRPKRHSLRLPGYDYSQAGAYFVTLCTRERRCLFGEIVNGEMCLNHLGRIVAEEWTRSLEIRKEIELDTWVVMPNHVHGIVLIASSVAAMSLVGATGQSPLREATGQSPLREATGQSPLREATGQSPLREATGRSPLREVTNSPIERPSGPGNKSLGSFVAGFKSIVTTRVNQLRNTPGSPVWQRNYYDHIIRNDREYAAIADYIYNNPVNWTADLDNPSNQVRQDALTMEHYLRDANIM